MSADGQIKSYFERWQNLEAEKKTISDDLKDLFAAAKGFGYDTKALRAAFNLKVKQDLDSPKDAEFEAIVDVYMSALNAPSVQARDARMRVRENIEKFDPETGEILEDINPRLIKQVVDGMQTEAGRAALIAAVDILIEQEEAEEEFHTNPEEDGEAKGASSVEAEDRAEGDTDRQRSPEAGTTDGGRQGVREQVASAPVPAPNSETHQRPSTNDEPSPEAGPQAEASPAGTGAGTLADREGGHNEPDQPLTGGDHEVTESANSQTLNNLLDGKPVQSVRKPLRPHCNNPGEHCGGYGSNHCHSCLRAAKEEEVAG